MPNPNLGWEEVKYLDLAKQTFGNKHVKLFDVGFNRGYFAETWLEIFPDSEIFGFEPIPDIFKIAKETFKNDNKVKIYNFGLSDEAGKMNFYYLLDGLDGCSGLYRRPVYDKFKYKEINVDIRIFDTFRHNFPMANFIKIDVEGAELKVLKGMKLYLKEAKPEFIHFESGDCTTDQKITFKEIWEFLESYNYEIMNRDFVITPAVAITDNYEGQNYLAIRKNNI